MSESPSLRNQGSLIVFLGGADLHKDPITHWNDARDETCVEVEVVTEQGDPVVTIRCMGGEVEGVAELLRSIATKITT